MNDIKTEIESTQKLSVAAIFDDKLARQPDSKSGILDKICEKTPEVAGVAIGNVLGQKLHAFAKDIDRSHPGLQSLFEGSLSGESSYSKQLCELLDLSELALANKMSIAQKLHKLVSRDKEKHQKDIERSIDSPLKNQLHIRFLPSREQRDSIRKTKRMQIMELGTIAKKGQELWDSLPNSFASYVRGKNIYEDAISVGEEKSNFLKEMGLSELSQSIQNDIGEIKELVSDTYFGFNKISMTNAAVVLAKICGYTVARDEVKKMWQITVPCSHFGKFEFYKKTHKPTDSLPYLPRSYVLNDFLELMPERVKNIVDRLENSPEIGGRSMFDHYRVLVPSVNYPTRGYESASFTDVNGKQISGNYSDIVKELDMTLIREGYIHPVLLAEKDESCYFICAWC